MYKFIVENRKQWNTVLRGIFPYCIPERTIWSDTGSINHILNVLADPKKAIVHVIYPHYGGQDLWGSTIINVEGFLKVSLNTLPRFLKPTSLTFICHKGNIEWAYFLMKTDEVFPVEENEGTGSEDDPPMDRLNTINPSDHISFEHIENNHGLFLLVHKASIYNRFGFYDGTHNRMGAEKFERYMEELERTNSIP